MLTLPKFAVSPYDNFTRKLELALYLYVENLHIYKYFKF